MENGKRYSQLKVAIPVFILIAALCMAAILIRSEFIKGLLLGIAASILAYYCVSLFESFYGVSNARRIEETVSHTIEKILPIAKDLSEQGLIRSFPRRLEIDWAQLEQNVQHRYWVCGTSMRPLAEKPRILNSIIGKGVDDIRIILPSAEDSSDFSYSQLDEYSQKVPDNEIELAKRSLNMISETLREHNKESCIRKYRGIMYECIAVHDDIAVIASYNSTGVGDDSWALQFRKDSPGYKYVEREFQTMWDASN